MTRKTRESTALSKASNRKKAVSAIEPNFDLGNDITEKNYQLKIDALNKKLDDYNLMIGKLNTMANELEELEKELNDYSDRVLSGVGSKYSNDSDEYEMAGGVKKSERKRGAKKVVPKKE